MSIITQSAHRQERQAIARNYHEIAELASDCIDALNGDREIDLRTALLTLQNHARNLETLYRK